jgi:RNA polymerase sigma-70 factor, ECF subfamily
MQLLYLRNTLWHHRQMSSASSEPNQANLTQRLNAGDHSDRELMRYVYQEMERLARRAMRQGPRGPTLSTGAVLNEAYLKIFSGDNAPAFRDRGHFLATAATAMRHVLVDYARVRAAEKRGAGAIQSLDALESLASGELVIADNAHQIVAIHEALELLDALDQRARKVFDMRFIAGFEVSDVAQALGVSEPTIKRDARFARAFVGDKLGWAVSSTAT